MSKEGLCHQGQVTRLHNHNSRHPRKAGKSAPSSMDQQSTKKKSAQGCPSRATGNKPQGSAPAAPTTQARGPSQAPPVSKPSTSQQDPPECNDTNGSTKAPTNSKGPGATKSKKALTNADTATQPYLTLLYVLDVVKVATRAKTVHIIIIFVIFVG